MISVSLMLGCGVAAFAGTALSFKLFGAPQLAPPESLAATRQPMVVQLAASPAPATGLSEEVPSEAAPLPAALDAPAAEEPEPPVQTPEEAVAAREQVFADLDARFAAQGADRRWRADAEGQLAAAFAPLQAGGVLRQHVECRSDMCVTTLEHPEAKLSARALGDALTTAMLPFELHIRYENGQTRVYSLRPEETATAE